MTVLFAEALSAKVPSKDRFIVIVWVLQFFVIGCMDIIFAITSGDLHYDYDEDIPSKSLWLLITGIIMVLTSTVYPIYSLTKSIPLLLFFSLLYFPSMVVFGILGAKILVNLSLAEGELSDYMIYFYMYIVNYIIGGGSLAALMHSKCGK